MFFFSRKKAEIAEASKEAQIKAIRGRTSDTIDETLKGIAKTTRKMKVVHEILKDDTIAGKMFIAMGGDRRIE